MQKDCVLIGHFDQDFSEQVRYARSMGKSGAYSDLRLAYFTNQSLPLRALDALNHLKPVDGLTAGRTLDNFDFLSPAIHQIGAYIARRGFTFDYVNLPHQTPELLTRTITNAQPRCIAITTTYYVSDEPLIELVARIRAISGNCPIVLGGPYIVERAKTLGRAELSSLLRDMGVDYAIASRDGEVAFANLLLALRTGANLSTVKNLIWFDQSGELQHNQMAIETVDLVVDGPSYEAFPAGCADPFLSLYTAKSCPFNCSFCGFPGRSGKYRYMDPIDVIAAFDVAAEQGTRCLTVLDDTFNVPAKRFKEILRLMIERRYEFSWNSFFRSDFGDDELVTLMAEAGCEGVFLGVESANDEMLKAMSKSARLKDYNWAVPAFRQSGISTYASLIVGFPGETEATLRDTEDFIERVAPDYYRAQLFYLDESSPIAARREEFGLEGGGFNWRHRTMDSDFASAYVESMFLRLRGSRWIPQSGFEIWSVYYLRQLGVSQTAIDGFIDAFNATVADKIVAETINRAPAPELLSRLTEACTLQAIDTSIVPPVPLFSDALGYWKSTLDAVPLSTIFTQRFVVKEFNGAANEHGLAHDLPTTLAAVCVALGQTNGLVSLTTAGGVTRFFKAGDSQLDTQLAQTNNSYLHDQEALAYCLSTLRSPDGASVRPAIDIEVLVEGAEAPLLGAPVCIQLLSNGVISRIEVADNAMLDRLLAELGYAANDASAQPDVLFSFENGE